MQTKEQKHAYALKYAKDHAEERRIYYRAYYKKWRTKEIARIKEAIRKRKIREENANDSATI